MSLYNMINGYNPAALMFLPMLGKHPDEYPRFRDCFLSDENHSEYNNHIHVYTRTGGGNRDSYSVENQAVRDMPGFITDYNDSFDETFASWIFEIPEQWKKDFDILITGSVEGVSIEYINMIKSIYPKLIEVIDKVFASK